MNIGEKNKRRRMELKWSQRELAAKMGYNHSTITRIETGKIDIPQSRKERKAVYVETILEMYIKGLISKELMQEKLNQ